MRGILFIFFCIIVAHAGFNPHLLEDRSFPLSGKFYYYPFYPSNSAKKAYNWVFQTPDGALYRLFGTTPTPNNIFGWSKTDKICKCPPSWEFYYIGDIDGDGDTRFDYVVIPALQGKQVFKMLPVGVGEYFKYEDLGFMHLQREPKRVTFFQGYIKYLALKRDHSFANLPKYLIFDNYADAKEAGFDYPLDFRYYNLLLYKIVLTSGSYKIVLQDPKFLNDQVIEVPISINKPEIGTGDMAYYIAAFGVSKDVQKVIFDIDGKIDFVPLSTIECSGEPEALVCGKKQIECITTPCKPLMQTYRNYCVLKADPQATFLHQGSCLDKKEINTTFVADTIWDRGVTLAYRLFAKQPNLIFSPLGIYTTMQMLYVGANGESKRELASFLKDESYSDTVASLAKLLQNFHTQTTFVMQNSVWVERSYKIYKSYRYKLEDLLQAYFASLDFMHNYNKAREEINAWVAVATHDKIKELLPPGSIDSYTRLVLVNALYFHGKWQQAFEKAKQESFFASNRELSVAMMQQKGRFFIVEDRDFKALQLPYKEGNLSMWLFLPKNKDLKIFLQSLHTLSLQKLEQNKVAKEVFLKFPRFSFYWGSFDIKDALALRTIFDPNQADFSLIAPKNKLYVSGVYHKAFIKVDEEGSEAAAATGAVVGITAAPMYEEFFCNRPFFFVIANKTVPLFMGIVQEP